MAMQQGAKVGLISRLDYGSRGFRKGIVDAGFELLRREGTHYNILLGGLISHEATKAKLKEFINKNLEQDKENPRRVPKDIKELPKIKQRAARKRQLTDKFLKEVAADLAKYIPELKIQDPEDSKKEKPVDLFIVTSPAFDGELGEQVAQYLSDLRSDIRVWNVGGDRFTVKFVDKLVWALGPQKAVWMRGDYYSTAVERVIKDKVKQTPQGSPDLYAVGCFGSAINKPKGELKFAYVSVPALHRLETTRVNENQIGCAVLEFPADGGQYQYSVYSLKDLVSQELSFIVPPEGASSIQKKAIELMKNKGFMTPGLLQHNLKDATLEQIEKEMDGLSSKKTINRVGENWPGTTYFPSGKKYYFDLDWIQRKLKYPVPSGPFNEDRLASFACLHGGSVETDIDYFINEVPEIILRTGATYFIDAGDTKEGLKHDLYIKGEVIPGMNNTVQEKFAAALVGTVMLKVFKARFTALAAELKKGSDGYSQKLLDAVRKSLLVFKYIFGNHDLWETSDGNTPLEIFKATLIHFLVTKTGKFLTESGHPVPYEQLIELVQANVALDDFFDLPSGLKVSVQHPHMSRAKTTSLRPQEMLEFAKRHGCQVAIGGNFHVSENVEEWDQDLGQCVCMEVGTIKHGSNFERHKMKMVDQGIGYLRILSSLEKIGNGKKSEEPKPRIFMTQSAFYGASEVRPPINPMDVVNAFIANRYGMEPID